MKGLQGKVSFLILFSILFSIPLQASFAQTTTDTDETSDDLLQSFFKLFSDFIKLFTEQEQDAILDEIESIVETSRDTGTTGATGTTETTGATGTTDTTGTTSTTDTTGKTSTFSAAATTVVNEAPKVTDQPMSLFKFIGEIAEFMAGATGVPTPTVQWEYAPFGSTSFVVLLGSTSTTHSISSVSESDEGQYRAVFTNGIGEDAITSPASLTIAKDDDGGMDGDSSASGDSSSASGDSGSDSGSSGSN